MTTTSDARETVRDPGWYTSGAVETIAKILVTGDWRCDGGR